MMNTTPQNQPSLVNNQRSDLADLADRLAHQPHRQSHYADLTARRDACEPAVNAFERRSEACPDSVKGPLNGLPITVKDQIAVAGWPRSFGLEKLNKRPDTHSADLVARLEALGAVVTGKTALPPNAMDFQTGNRRRGPTCNPHNPKFTPGGSTGGGAAAVASGMSMLDVGSDLGGSLRLPAAWCGVTSYTPSEGLWPNDGMLRGSQSLAHFARVGLTARSASDLSYIWHLLESETSPKAETVKPVRIALWKQEESPECDPDTLANWEDLHKAASQNADIAADPMAALFDPDIYRLAGEIIGYETGALVPWPIRWLMRRDRRARQTSPGFVAHVHVGYQRNHRRYADNLQTLSELRARALEIWEDVDALLLPVSAVCAFEHTAPLRDQAGVRTYDKVFNTGASRLGYFDALTRFTLPLTALGWPVVTVPVGTDSNGIPVGAQLVGKPGQDSRLLVFAQEMQSWMDV